MKKVDCGSHCKVNFFLAINLYGIYLLYITGDSSYVLEYDWSGSATKQYKITSKVDRFFIDNDGKCIYALCPINGKYSLICYNLE